MTIQNESVLEYLSEEEYKAKIKGLINGETRNIYKTERVEIDVIKNGRKIFKMINYYDGTDKIENCLQSMYDVRTA